MKRHPSPAEKSLLENIAMVHEQSRRVLTRSIALKLNMEYEDIFQELSMLYVKCFERLDPTQGKISTYFYSSVNWEMNRKLSRAARDKECIGSTSLDAAITEDGGSLHDMVKDPFACQIDEKEVIQERLGVFKRNMSPLAVQIVDMAVSPPDWLEREFDACEAHSEFASEVGMMARASTQLNHRFIGKTLGRMGVDTTLIRNALQEIEERRELI